MTLNRAFNHDFLDLGDCLGRVQPFGAGLRTVHDGVAAVNFVTIFIYFLLFRSIINNFLLFHATPVL